MNPLKKGNPKIWMFVQTFLLISSLFCYSLSLSQPTLESLEKEWKDQSLSDSVRLEAGFGIFVRNIRTQPEKAVQIAAEMANFADEVQLENWHVRSTRLIGNAYAFQGKFEQALSHFEQSCELALAYHDSLGLAIGLNNVGIVHYEQGNFPKSLAILQESLALSEILKDTSNISRAYTNIANVYIRQPNYDKAIAIIEENIQIKKALKDKGGLAKAYNNIGLAYEKMGKFEEAIRFYELCIHLSAEIGNTEDQATALHNLGVIYVQQNQREKGLELVNEALQLSQQMQDQYGMALAYTSRGKIFLATGQYSKAQADCIRGLEMAAEIQVLPTQQESCQCLYEAYKASGNLEQALSYHEQFTSYKDSLYNKANTEELTRLSLQYEFDKQQLSDSLKFVSERVALESQITQETNRNRITLFIILPTILFLFIGTIFYLRQQEQQRKIETKEIELAREKELNDRLTQIDKLKDQFLANTSHELRTPLNGIIGLSESLVGRVEFGDQQEDLQMIISSGKRLTALVNDILDFSQIKNNEIKLYQKKVDIKAVVDVVLQINQPLVEGKMLSLENAVGKDLPPVWADENRLQQILFNLIGNATKFTEVGYVRVGAYLKNKGSDEHFMTIFVADTGIGIPESKREAIFQEFEQVDGTIQREFAGTGLGLSISKYLTELHGGKMWVESKVGKGSTFFLTIPLAERIEVTASTAATPSVQVPNVVASTYIPELENSSLQSRNLEEEVRILVVDDEPINQQVLKNHLADQGFNIYQAMNGYEAIEQIERNDSFDLVLLDIMMPRMSGYEVCQKIREQHLVSELPVIMITAKDQLTDIVQGLSLGANDYLPKPFDKEELLARINTQLDLRRIFTISSKFVPNEFLRSLNRNRITEVKLGDHAETEMTILFSDIRGYTTLSETMTPEENFAFVNTIHGIMGPIIRKFDGFVNQYLGDGILAIFPHRSQNALEAAIHMQKALDVYNMERKKKGRKKIQMGTGMHTGSLIMGIIGDQKRMDAATIADSVNTAARIESLTKHYATSILVSEDSLKQFEDTSDFLFRYLGKVQLKGKTAPVGLYECFNGDEEQLIQKKLATLPEFEKGLTQFLDKAFHEASASFKNVLQHHPEDHIAQLFLTKSHEYLIKGVPENWDGVERMNVK